MLFILRLAETKTSQVIQVDIGGHPPFPTRLKQIYGNFANLLFLTVLTSGAILRAEMKVFRD